MFGMNPEDLYLETLTQEDLDDYKRRMGRNSPTPQDAMRFAALQMALGKYLKGKDLEDYNKAIQNRDTATVEKLERKIIRRKDKPDHVDKRSNIQVPVGTRVRMKVDGKEGVTCKNEDWVIVTPEDSGRFTVQIANEEEPRKDLKRNEFNVLCFNGSCRERGTNRCSKCLQAWYSSQDCQRAAWKTHKPKCKPFGKVDTSKVAFLPPIDMRSSS